MNRLVGHHYSMANNLCYIINESEHDPSVEMKTVEVKQLE